VIKGFFKIYYLRDRRGGGNPQKNKVCPLSPSMERETPSCFVGIPFLGAGTSYRLHYPYLSKV